MHEINHHVIKDHFKDLSEPNFFEERTTRFLHSNKAHSYIAHILSFHSYAFLRRGRGGEGVLFLQINFQIDF